MSDLHKNIKTYRFIHRQRRDGDKYSRTIISAIVDIYAPYFLQEHNTSR